MKTSAYPVQVVLGHQTGSAVRCSVASPEGLCFPSSRPAAYNQLCRFADVTHKSYITHQINLRGIKRMLVQYYEQFSQAVSILMETSLTIGGDKQKKCHQLQGVFVSRNHFVLKNFVFFFFNNMIENKTAKNPRASIHQTLFKFTRKEDYCV